MTLQLYSELGLWAQTFLIFLPNGRQDLFPNYVYRSPLVCIFSQDSSIHIIGGSGKQAEPLKTLQGLVTNGHMKVEMAQEIRMQCQEACWAVWGLW